MSLKTISDLQAKLAQAEAAAKQAEAQKKDEAAEAAEALVKAGTMRDASLEHTEKEKVARKYGGWLSELGADQRNHGAERFKVAGDRLVDDFLTVDDAVAAGKGVANLAMGGALAAKEVFAAEATNLWNKALHAGTQKLLEWGNQTVAAAALKAPTEVQADTSAADPMFAEAEKHFARAAELDSQFNDDFRSTFDAAMQFANGVWQAIKATGQEMVADHERDLAAWTANKSNEFKAWGDKAVELNANPASSVEEAAKALEASKAELRAAFGAEKARLQKELRDLEKAVGSES
jgi:hypothetical protein